MICLAASLIFPSSTLKANEIPTSVEPQSSFIFHALTHIIIEGCPEDGVCGSLSLSLVSTVFS
jgi:hypothetical protein